VSIFPGLVLIFEEENMTTLLIIVLVLLLVGALPTWPYSSGWGYFPSGIIGLIVVVLLIMFLMGRL
jgi:sterol desaturase/sphingolipid hydroxylase (fatty acid hydroxylase superfamily)